MSGRIKRVYHHYLNWEDWKAGLYRQTNGLEDWELVPRCSQLLKDPGALRIAMIHVAMNWKFSAQENLSNPSRNHQAWLGQAACCHVHGAPEHITKAAWHGLSSEEQSAANAVADSVYEIWANRHAIEAREKCQRDLFPQTF